MERNILLNGFLLIFCLSSGCGLLNEKVIYSSSQAQVQVSPSQNRPRPAILKDDCSLQIKNFYGQTIDV